MPISKAITTTKYIERPKDGRFGLTLLQASVIDRNCYDAALARKSREMKEFLATLHNKSVAK